MEKRFTITSEGEYVGVVSFDVTDDGALSSIIETMKISCEPMSIHFEEKEARRFIAGMEVTDGWEMPEPPREGLEPYFTMHGTDGISFFWWDPSWAKYPDDWTAWEKIRREGLEDTLCDIEPLVHLDTGSNYKGTAKALEELGFKGYY